MKKKKDNQDEIELRKNPVNVFSCGHENCKSIEAIPADKIRAHLVEVHGLRPDQFKGKRQMVAHIDGDYWYSYNYEWTLDSGLTLHQYIRLARDEHSRMYR
jgi:hypothetical protein